MATADAKKLKSISSFHAAFIALASHSLCCILPLVLVALGSTGLVAGFNFGRYHALFSTIGIASLAVGFYLYWRESKQPCGCCACSVKKVKAQRRQSLAILMAAVLLQGSIWAMMAFQTSASAQDVQSLSAKIALASPNADSEIFYDLKGVHCLGCGMEAELMVRELPGVASAELNFSKALLGIRFDSSQITAPEIESSLKKLGMEYKKNQLTLVQPSPVAAP